MLRAQRYNKELKKRKWSLMKITIVDCIATDCTETKNITDYTPAVAYNRL